VTEYYEKDTDLVLDYLEQMSHHLTAALVSNDPIFTDKCLGRTINGTTYHGLRARTTGAP
jgi:1-pyrroline-5-carboxylate dehydrogenase